MRVLVACEYSGTVRDAFLARGHDAVSCDLLPTEAEGPHYQGDALDIIGQGWDLMIGHPPCTYLTYSGAQYWKDQERLKRRDAALTFFQALYAAPIKRIALENPRGWASTWMRPHQEINPFEFGQPIRKRVCLWLKGLPPLFATEIVALPEPKFCIRKTGPRAGKRYNYYFHQGKSGHGRSRFFPGIAAAMADQWGGL